MDDDKALDDYECEGQMSLSDLYPEPEPTLIAVSKIFARAAKTMSLGEWKTFLYALTKIRWKEKNNSTVYLDKKVVAKLVDVHSDTDHLSQDVFRALKSISKDSYIELSKEDKGKFKGGIAGVIISSIKVDQRNTVIINFAPENMTLFEELGREGDYITLWASDLFGMSSERSILFYESLRLHSDTRKSNSRIYSTKELKEMFRIPFKGKGSYMKTDGHFNRYMFEKKVLDPLVMDLAKCRMIRLEIPEGGKGYWEKVKIKGKVAGYRFFWIVSTHPGIASADEVKRLNQDPQTLKIAKDIARGKKKADPTKTNDFTHFDQNSYNFDDLEKTILSN